MPNETAISPTKKFKGYVDIEILGTPFHLDGSIGDVIAVGWRAGQNGQKEVAIGTIPDIIKHVAEALVGPGDAADFASKLDGAKATLSKTPALGDVLTKLWDLEIYVTDLYIKAEAKGKEDKDKKAFSITEAAFGFRGDFKDGDPAKLGPVTLKGFGLLFEYTVGADGKGNGNATPKPPAQ